MAISRIISYFGAEIKMTILARILLLLHWKTPPKRAFLETAGISLFCLFFSLLDLTLLLPMVVVMVIIYYYSCCLTKWFQLD